MKFNSLKINLSILALALLVTGTSCKKNSGDEKKGSPTEAAENNAFAEAQYNDVTTLLDQASVSGSVTFGTAGSGSGNGVSDLLGCASATVDTTSNPHTIVIDFGTTNCMGIDGRNRRGKILASYSGRFREQGTVINITFDNYFVNDHKIAGTKKITNQGNNQSGNLVYKVEVNGVVTKPTGNATYTWISTRMREWKAGATTPLNILDDVYGITGTANGVTFEGVAYTLTATQELVRKMNCRWFESGKLELTQSGFPAIVLDYGTTGCDANATISVLGISYPVILQ